MTRSDSVLIDMNSLIWVSPEEFLGGARSAASATFPFAKNDLASDQVRLALAPSELVRCETARQPMAASGQNEPCHSLRRHGRSTSVSGPSRPAVGASESGQFRTRALQERWSSLGDGFAR